MSHHIKSSQPSSSAGKQAAGRSRQSAFSFVLGLAAVVLLFCAAFFLSKTWKAKNVTYEKHTYVYWDVLDTISTIQVYLTEDQDSDYYENWIHEQLLSYHQLFDAYHTYDGVNNVCTVNEQAGREAVVVEEPLYDLVRFCVDQMEATRSRTNIAFGSVTAIWKQFMSEASAEQALAASENREPVYLFPEESVLSEASRHTEIGQILLDEAQHSIYLSDPDMRLDVGAAAKGFICEHLAQDMQAAGIDSACISLGGNVKVIGQYRGSEDRTYFTSAITNPSDSTQYLDFKLKLDDQTCVVTSGNYERFVDIDGVRYCHLVDPDTLYPAQGMSSVTILCTDSTLADYLSTALFTVDIETGKEILSHYDGVEAFWITDTYEVTYTDGFMDYVIQ